MSYKDIIVFLDPFVGMDDRVKLAVCLARQHSARLIGVDVSTRAALEDRTRFQSSALEDKFMKLLTGTGLKKEFRVADARARSWKDYYAHFADLVVAPQYDPSAEKTLKVDIVEPVLLAAGAPVLILPPGWRLAPVGKRVAISWNASREATRAVHDALPLLRRADKVFLFQFAPQADLSESALGLMADHLRQHDIPAELLPWQDSGDATPINALFALLDEHEIDLIVSGAFGHSRGYEHLFGGMTDDLLRQPSMPILMSH